MVTLLYQPTKYCFIRNKVYITFKSDVLETSPDAESINIVLKLLKYNHLKKTWVDFISINQLINSVGLAVFEISEILKAEAIKPELNYYFYENEAVIRTYDMLQFRISYGETYILDNSLVTSSTTNLQTPIVAIDGGISDWQANLLAEIGARPENLIKYKKLSLSTSPEITYIGPDQPIIWNLLSFFLEQGYFKIYLYDSDNVLLFTKTIADTLDQDALFSINMALFTPDYSEYKDDVAKIKILFTGLTNTIIGEKTYYIDRESSYNTNFAYRNSLGVFETIASRGHQELTSVPKSTILSYSDNHRETLNNFPDINNIATLINTALNSRGGRLKRKLDENLIQGKLSTGNYITGSYEQIIDFLISQEVYILNKVSSIDEATQIERIIINDIKIVNINSLDKVINVEFEYFKTNYYNQYNCLSLSTIQHHVLPPNYENCELILNLHIAGIITGYMPQHGKNRLEIACNLIGGSYDNDTDYIEFKDYSLLGADKDYFNFTDRTIWDETIEYLIWYQPLFPRRCLVSFLTPNNIEAYCLLTNRIFVNSGVINPIGNCLPIICYKQAVSHPEDVENYLYKHKLNAGTDEGEYHTEEYDLDEYYI